MKHFFYKLIPPRPTFPADITEAEGAIMQEHFGYWGQLIAERKAIVFGPVMDTTSVYGAAVLEVADDAEAEVIALGDPAIKANAGFTYALHAMPDAKVRP